MMNGLNLLALIHAVGQGIAWFDEVAPRWEYKWDPARFNILLPDRCAVGMVKPLTGEQIDEVDEQDYYDVESLMGTAFCAAHGFQAESCQCWDHTPSGSDPMNHDETCPWRTLQVCWRAVIKYRFDTGTLSA